MTMVSTRDCALYWDTHFSTLAQALLDDQDNEDDEMPWCIFPKVYPTPTKIGHISFVNLLETCEDEKFLMLFHLQKKTVVRLLKDIHDRIDKETERYCDISSDLKLLVTLLYFATGFPFLVLAKIANVTVPMATYFIKRVTEIIALKESDIIKMPTQEEREYIKRQFKLIANFPKVIGAISTCHVKLQQNQEEPLEDNFRNKKGIFSLKVQAVCDPSGAFRSFVSSWPGRARDHDMFRLSHLHGLFREGDMGDSLLVGGRKNKLRCYMMTPKPEPETIEELAYNSSLHATHSVVRRSFRSWKNRFPALRMGIQLPRDDAVRVCVAAAVLHNMAIEDASVTATGQVVDVLAPSGRSPPAEPITAAARRRRHIIAEYFGDRRRTRDYLYEPLEEDCF